MTRLEAIDDIQDWLHACVSAGEADGYQQHEECSWCDERGAPELYCIEGGFEIRYRGRTFEMRIVQKREERNETN